MDVGCNKTLSKPPSVVKKYYPHLLGASIGDKQFPWHLIPIVGEIKHLIHI
jgi:hypothetical protein